MTNDDIVRTWTVASTPPSPGPIEDDFEGISDPVSQLPLPDVDLGTHCQEGEVPKQDRQSSQAARVLYPGIYDIGNCIGCVVNATASVANQVKWLIPAPLDAIIEACIRDVPVDRPT